MALRVFASQAASALRISTRPRTFAAPLAPFFRQFSSKFPPEKKYSKSHEWIHVEGGTGTMGLTSFALEQLGDVVFVELPEVGRVVNPGESFCTVESVKAASAVYSPIGGEVIEVNEEMAANPEQVNKDPHGGSWLVKLKVADPSHLDSLLDADSYQEVVEKEKH